MTTAPDDSASAHEPSHGSLLRVRPKGGPTHGEVKFAELFFDLVFVFAITQLSHLLIAHLTLRGAIETGLLLLAVWWVWIYTSWATNWLDPDRPSVRLMLFGLMLVGLVMSTSIPQAFGSRGLAFAAAFVFMQVSRSLFMIWAMRHTPRGYRNFQRIAVWSAFAGVFWICGAFLDPTARLWVWAVAMGIELAGPALGFTVPTLGRSMPQDWDVSGDHMAERCGLFVIIALGESILVTGATWAEQSWSATTTCAFIVGVIGSIAMWWIYFHIGAERARNLMQRTDDAGGLARIAYTYVHVILIAGIVLGAVSDEIILIHPTGHAEAKYTAVILGGPAFFVLGNLLFKWITAGMPPLSHMIGLALLAGLALLSPLLAPLVLGALATGVLIVVAGWEMWSLGEPSRQAHH
jgi:low temperature requirement protein LtrA